MLESSPPTSAHAPAALASWRKVRASLREHLEHLAHQVDEAAADREFMAMLAGAARLWRYSPFNQFWLRHQCPSATSVRGRREWEAAGRPILEGEQPIFLFAPRSHGQGSPWPPLAVGVFDISQTKGGKVEYPITWPARQKLCHSFCVRRRCSASRSPGWSRRPPATATRSSGRRPAGASS